LIGKENYFSQYHYIEDLHSIQCPVNGIATALDNSNSDWIYVLACDMPLIKTNIINYLYANIFLEKQAVIPLLNDKLQPLCGFYNKSILDEINKSINREEYSLFKLLYQLDIKKIAIPINMKKQFLNVNYKDDLKKI
jgi:molybdopterin-guanine dinucleotide biosynthesis protein A